MTQTLVHRAPKAFKDEKSGVYCAGTLSRAEEKKIGAARVIDLVEAGKLVEVDLGLPDKLRAERLKAREAMAAPTEEKKPKAAKRGGRAKK